MVSVILVSLVSFAHLDNRSSLAGSTVLEELECSRNVEGDKRKAMIAVDLGRHHDFLEHSPCAWSK